MMDLHLQTWEHTWTTTRSDNVKRILPIMIICMLIIHCAVAEDIDLTGLSFDDLRILQTRVSKELITRPEWKSVPVPPGMYMVGVDIPEGEWTITCGEAKYDYIRIVCGAKTNESRTSIYNPKEFERLVYRNSDGKELEKLTVTLSNGLYIFIQHGQAIFSTPEHIDLGF